MQVVPSPGDVLTDQRPVSLAIGMFDGVHLGHQRLLGLAQETAHQRGGLAVAITFDQHPNQILAPERAPRLLQSLDHRLSLLNDRGLDATVVIPFDEAFSQIPAPRFVKTLVQSLSRVSDICIGQGFTFGCQRAGNTALLEALGRELGYTTRTLAPVCLGDQVIRSTRIRESVRCGALDQAGSMLGRPYSIAANVESGDQLGRQLGFPTANLGVADLILPPSGVYLAHAIVDGHTHPAILNLGHRPTLAQPEPQLRLEVHLLDFDGDLYGQPLEAMFGTQLRPEQQFDSLDQLRNQIREDVLQARAILAQE